MRRIAISIGMLAPLVLLACAQEAGDKADPGPPAVPAAMARAEGLAEDIQADIDTREWAAADGRLGRIRRETDAVTQGMIDENGDVRSGQLTAFRSGLDSLKARVGRRDRLGALEAANGLSRVLAATAQSYSVAVPASVTVLDVAGRDVIYRSEGGRWSGAANSARELRGAYGAVRAHVSRQDAALDEHVRRRLDEIDAAVRERNAAAVRTAATALLDEVDLIEQTYG